jgi:hypothetical protein
MFKYAILVLASCLSFSAFANGSVDVNPASPVVILADLNMPDGTSISAPWFVANYILNADDQDIVVSSLQITINSTDGSGTLGVTMVPLDPPMHIAAGQSATLSNVYLGNLPVSTNTDYYVMVQAIGYNGDIDLPGQELQMIGTFQTQ